MKNSKPKVAFYYTLDFQKNVLKSIAEHLDYTIISNEISEIELWKPDFVFTADYNCRFLSDYLRESDVEILAIRHGAVNKYSQPEEDFSYADYVFGTEYEKNYLQSGGVMPKQEFILTGNAWIDKTFLIKTKVLNTNSPTILFAPTYNPEISAASVPGNKLYEILTKAFSNFRLIIKPHPAVLQITMEHLKKNELIFKGWLEYWKSLSDNYKNIDFITDAQITANQFFAESDILISDKSSLIWEYIILEKPVLLYKNDLLPEFWSNLITDYSIDHKLDVGPHYKNDEEFYYYLTEIFNLHKNYYQKKQRQYKNELFGKFQDGFSSKRIAEEIMRLFNSDFSSELILKAEELIQQNSLEQARKILQRAKNKNKLRIDALNDLAYLEIVENNYKEAFLYILDVLRYNPNDEIALNNLSYLIDNKLIDFTNNKKNVLKSLFGNLVITKLSSFEEFVEYEKKTRLNAKSNSDYELSIIPKELKNFSFLAYCIVCEDIVPFHVDFWNAYNINGKLIPNWRERLVCPSCGLNNRMRLTYHLISDLLANFSSSSVYITEQTTNLFKLLKRLNPSIIGSEFLDDEIPKGSLNSAGIRNEDFTNLTFSDNQFDYIISLEVLEHIPDYKKALKESFRTLKPKGKFLFTVPFNRNSRENIVRAKLNDDGTITHILPPEYHGDPLNRIQGCLCYYHFGWEILDDLKSIGYQNAYALFSYSKDYGYLGGEQIFFIAEKGA